MATTADEVWQLLGELIQAQKETERLLQEQAQEAKQHRQEAEQRRQEAEQRFRVVILNDAQFQPQVW